MSRSQQNEVYNQSLSNSRQDQANAGQALQGVGAGLTKYQTALDDYMSANPYKTGGEFQKDQSMINASRAQSYSDALGDELESSGRRSGENTAGYKNTLEQGTAKATRDEATAQSASDAQRLAADTMYQQFGVEGQKFPVQTNAGIYGTSIGGANSALNTSEEAAKQKSFWEQVFSDATKGAAAGAEAAAA